MGLGVTTSEPGLFRTINAPDDSVSSSSSTTTAATKPEKKYREGSIFAVQSRYLGELNE